MRMIASRWLGMETYLGEQCVSARIFGVDFAVFAADRLGLAREQHFGS